MNQVMSSWQQRGWRLLGGLLLVAGAGRLRCTAFGPSRRERGGSAAHAQG